MQSKQRKPLRFISNRQDWLAGKLGKHFEEDHGFVSPNSHADFLVWHGHLVKGEF